MDFAALPTVNACLNGLSTLLLLAGYYFIRRQDQAAHRNCMVAATLTSMAFLASYLVYHAHAGRTVFRDPAWFRPIYLAILLTHTVLAAAIVPLVLTTLCRAARGQFERHAHWARWTWPIWLYVSVTGVAIYFLLYQIFPQRSSALDRARPAAEGGRACPPSISIPIAVGRMSPALRTRNCGAGRLQARGDSPTWIQRNQHHEDPVLARWFRTGADVCGSTVLNPRRRLCALR